MSSSTFVDYPTLRTRTEDFVKKELSGNDASHDWQHIARVRALALSLAHEEGLTLNNEKSASELELIELSALLHDIADWKYSGSETKGIEMAKEFLTNQQYPSEKVSRICTIIEQIGFKSELGRIEAARASGVPLAVDPLVSIVQDADRLDAIGAIGIARCFTYGGAKGRALYDESQPHRTDLTMAEYKSSSSASSPSINHFYEKLLKLKDLMKTAAGRKRAEKRQQVMLQFLHDFDEECHGRA